VRYRKKPVVVEAVRYDGPAYVTAYGDRAPRQDASFESVRQFVGSAFTTAQVGSENHGGPNQFAPAIRTLEGVMRVCPGDWIIRGVKGECYPCKPDIFAATYELAEARP
jgi:hypothetical protein